MSYPIMEALIEGRMNPWERRCPMCAEQKAIEEKIENERRYFAEKMSLDDCKRFNELEDLYGDAGVYGKDNFYLYGFTLGMLLMMEVMQSKEGM